MHSEHPWCTTDASWRKGQANRHLRNHLRCRCLYSCFHVLFIQINQRLCWIWLTRRESIVTSMSDVAASLRLRMLNTWMEFIKPYLPENLLAISFPFCLEMRSPTLREIRFTQSLNSYLSVLAGNLLSKVANSGAALFCDFSFYHVFFFFFLKSAKFEVRVLLFYNLLRVRGESIKGSVFPIFKYSLTHWLKSREPRKKNQLQIIILWKIFVTPMFIL